MASTVYGCSNDTVMELNTHQLLNMACGNCIQCFILSSQVSQTFTIIPKCKSKSILIASYYSYSSSGSRSTTVGICICSYNSMTYRLDDN